MWLLSAAALAGTAASDWQAAVPVCAPEVVAVANTPWSAPAGQPPPSEALALALSGYVDNGLKQKVNAAWMANIDSLPPTVRLRSPTYETKVAVTLDATGGLVALCLQASSGSAELDLAVAHAFQASAPFPPPPPELAHDGAWMFPNLSFTIQVGPQRRAP